MRHLLLISLAICLCYANSNHHNNYLVPPPSYMLDGVTEPQIRSYMKFLSDPLLEGRGVGTRGESIAAKYVASLLTTWGIEPAGNDGTYFQSVGMKGTLATEKSSLVFSGPDNSYTTTQNFKDDYCLTTQKLPSSTDTLSFENEEVVFVGYGIVAPDYNWDDYKGVDVAGKIVIMLVNQPNNSVFLNEPMTYYGRWTYKFEEAARHNAKGAILVHTYATASYGWSTIQGSWCNLVTRNTVVPSFPLHLHGWLSESKSDELARKNGKSLVEWFTLAAQPTFTPIPLTCTAAVSMKFTLSYFNATNVIGRIRGTLLPNEAVVLSGHIDHLGIRSGVTMPGALDNGSGTSITLTLAKVFSTFHSFLTNRFVRSVVFFFPTAEESGLLGSDYFINNLPTPLASTQFVADLNYDIANAWGPAEDISLLGADKSTLGDIFDVACAEEDMYVSPDPLPASGFFFRGDQFTFAKAGVPAVWLYTGSHYVGQPSNYFTDHVQNGYFKNCYHASCDSYSDSIDISGMVQMARVGLRVAYGIAQNPFLTPECNDPCY